MQKYGILGNQDGGRAIIRNSQKWLKLSKMNRYESHIVKSRVFAAAPGA